MPTLSEVRAAFIKENGGLENATLYLEDGETVSNSMARKPWLIFPTGAIAEQSLEGACHPPPTDPLRLARRKVKYWKLVVAARDKSHARLYETICATFLYDQNLPPQQQHSIVRGFAGKYFEGDEEEAEEALRKSRTEYLFAQDSLRTAQRVLAEEEEKNRRPGPSDLEIQIESQERIKRKAKKFEKFALTPEDKGAWPE